MKRFILFVLTMLVVGSATAAQTIANCGSLSGIGNYHFAGLTSKNDSGFQKDEITGGINTFQKVGPDSYDILIVDTRKEIFSLAREGGQIVLLRKGANDATFMHFYPGMVIELYTLWTDKDGVARFDLIQSKGGNQMPVHKSAVLTGKCDSIRFDLLD